ncbi:MAG: YceI family protein [Planctomycetota bacterium]
MQLKHWLSASLLSAACLAAPSAFAQSGSDGSAAVPALQPVVRPAVVRYVVEPATSEVGFDGTSTLHDFTGRTRSVSGELLADPKAPTTFAAGRIDCQAATLDTDNGGRDEKMREHLDVEHFPLISFTLARAEAARDAANEVDVAGTFAIHGVQRDVHVTCTLEVAADGALHVKGRAPIKLTDHGIVPPKVVLIEVGDLVEVWFDLRLTPVAEEELEARAHRVSVAEHIEPAGGASTDARYEETLFVGDAGLLWERPSAGQWLVRAPGGAPRSIALASGVVADRALTADESFAEARETMQRLREKLDKLDGVKRERAERAVADTLQRLDGQLKNAPAPAALERVKVADGERWTLGGVTWLELHGARGEGRIAPLLGCIEGLPGAVRDALEEVAYVPERVVVRAATMGGLRTLDVRIGEGAPGRFPAHALALAAETSEAGAQR